MKKLKEMEILNFRNFEKVPKSGDLYYCIRHFLRFGRCLGIVPFQEVFQNDISVVRFRYKSVPAVISVVISILLLINILVGAYGFFNYQAGNASEWVWALEPLFFFSMGFITYTHFLRRGEHFIHLLQKWNNVQGSLDKYEEDYDNTLSRDINVIAGCLFISDILENVVFHVNAFGATNNILEDGASNFELYYKNSRTHWPQLIPFNEGIATVIFFCNKFANYSWNFTDILIVLITRAFSRQFSVLIKQGNRIAKEADDPTRSLTKIRGKLEDVVRSHRGLCDLLEDFETFLSPLVFFSHWINLYAICIQLHLGLTSKPKDGFLRSLYACWAFVHLIVKICMISYYAGSVNQYGCAGFAKMLHSCPSSLDSTEISKRASFLLGSPPIGITGLGCFLITRPFILKVINVVFTFEIVLLQASTTSITVSCNDAIGSKI